MSRAVTIIAGGTSAPPGFLRDRTADTCIIAADRGGAYALQAGLLPDLVVGDLDSIGAETLAVLKARGVAIEVHPAEKDQSDFELALRAAFAREASEITVLCAFGGRLDHLLTNVMVLIQARAKGVACRMVAPEVEAFLVDGTAEIGGQPGDLVTLLALSDAHGVTTEGLRYALRDERLRRGSSRGLSNVMLESPARVRVASGDLLVVVTRCTAVG